MTDRDGVHAAAGRLSAKLEDTLWEEAALVRKADLRLLLAAVADTANRDAAAAGADAMVEGMAQALHSLLWHHGPQPYSDRVYRWRDCNDPYCAKMRAVLPAPAAAPRESGVVGAVLRELEWRHWSTRDGDERMCLLCERDESRGHAPECRMAAAIEAARGEGDTNGS